MQHASSQKRILHQGQRGRGKEEEARGGREGTELAGGVAVVSQMLAESELASRVLDSVLCRLWEIDSCVMCVHEGEGEQTHWRQSGRTDISILKREWSISEENSRGTCSISSINN